MLRVNFYFIKLQVPSGTRIYAQRFDMDGVFMSIHLVVVGNRKLEGMCGSPDGIDSNDLKIADTNVTLSKEQLVQNPFYGPEIPKNLAASWTYVRNVKVLNLCY
jgi:hypothetical protein